MFSHTPKDHLLRGGGIEHLTVEVEFAFDSGDWVEIYVEVGESRLFKSNPLVLTISKEARGVSP
jgi:hypothetical protein